MTNPNAYSDVSGKRIGRDPQANHTHRRVQFQDFKHPPRPSRDRRNGIYDPRGGRRIVRCTRVLRDGAAFFKHLADFAKWAYAVWRDQRNGRVC